MTTTVLNSWKQLFHLKFSVVSLTLEGDEDQLERKKEKKEKGECLDMGREHPTCIKAYLFDVEEDEEFDDADQRK